ncbi:Esterase-like activity of phytase [Monaibacterium marinum]|uniref:Esterase-like activity of phytase n=1 Tax=Pontivivens marinum TaxID=1690039 RepID=A0A2C9CU60_9RHOB|nr:esterase-like activity of phytase family protein [Monaibacterium marinum]SOH93929.1 Esterase-like activity of phytase [Monaibacterium marinum]
MKIANLGLTSALALFAATAVTAQEMSFNRIASFPVASNSDGAAETSSEIITASGDGMTLIYSDSPLGVIGFIDITDAANPAPLGTITMDGEPTAVSAVGNSVIAGVNTSESYSAPSGFAASFAIDTMGETARCDLAGQPDSTAVAKDGSFIAIAIENERDEDAGDGRIGQMPGGTVALIDLDADGVLVCDTIRFAEVTGLAEIGADDPEPEFVDINDLGEVVVTMQENNHIVVLDRDAAVISHFSAGTVDLTGIDATDERAAMIFTESRSDIAREPDGVQWIDDTYLAMANEGDMDGGTRGWSVFHKDGTLVWDSGTSFEYAVIEAGHYPDKRSDAKGGEPEGMEFATINGTPMVFILSERGSLVGVYDVTDPTNPVLTQLLPSGVAPEGAVAIPSRNLLVTANEADLAEDGGARSHVMLFEFAEGAASYPHLTSAGADELIGWSALSGLAADPEQNGTFYAVNDSFYGYQPTIFTIDATQTPARITDALPVTRGGHPAQKLDMEGITTDGEGGFWIASEGRTDRMIPHGIYHVDAEGEITTEIPFPAELLAVEARFGSEGITMIGSQLWIAIQRNWADDADNMVKLVSYDLETEEWGAVLYERTVPETGWVGLSEIVAHGDYVYLIERDNQIGDNAVTKLITRVPMSEMVAAPLGSELPVVSHEVVLDLIPALSATGGYVVDKIEGMAFDADGNAWIVTDNDGVDDSSGETLFLNLGEM